MDGAVYNDLIISLSKELKFVGPIACPDYEATLNNPLCGDQVTIQICTEHEHVVDFRHQVRGCILCKASAALLASFARGMTLSDIVRLRESLTAAINPTSKHVDIHTCHEIFRPVWKHRSRHSCVLLPYNAAIQALSSFVLQAPKNMT